MTTQPFHSQKLAKIGAVTIALLALRAPLQADPAPLPIKITPRPQATLPQSTEPKPEEALSLTTLRKFEPAWGRVYHGASLPEFWSDSGLQAQHDKFRAASGKGLATLTWFATVHNNGRLTSWSKDYAPMLARVHKMGAASLIKLSTTDSSPQSTRFASPKQIGLGVWDAYFDEFADTVKAFNSPVFISINHEMNGTWYPYSEAAPGSENTAADYVKMWRRIVDIFRQRGANNVAWVWSPNIPDVGPVPATSYYPGDDYVDWVGVSFYSANRPTDLDKLYKTYSQRKPFFITEWATNPAKNLYNPKYPGDAAWVNQFFDSLETRYQRVKAISWFQWNAADGSYTLGRVPAQREAYARRIKNPRYLEKVEDLLAPAPAK